MPLFVDRKTELEDMEDEYGREESSFLVVYGRRRIGKTSLIREFIKNKPALYYLATEEPETQNRETFQALAAAFTGNEFLKSARLDDWALIFDALVSRKTPEKMVIVLDEFQYLGQSNPAFPSILQKIWDTRLRDRAVMLILCGSYISMMESQTLAYDSPLYGRRTAQIRLRQIPFAHYGEFFPDKNRKELVQFYSVTGGVPKYIELFRNQGDIYGALDRDVLSRNSFLYDEPNFLLHRELGQVGSYFSIIRTIAAGNRKLGNIAALLNQKQTGLTKYLTTLINLDILEREVPVTEIHPEKSKRGLYRIKDNFMLFWFKFIYPAMSYIESGNQSLVMQKIRQTFIDTHVSFIYEDICREELRRLEASGWEGTGEETFLPAWKFHTGRIGRWWDNREEIDIVAFDSGGEDMVFGECKYQNHKAGPELFYKLEEKVRAFPWKREERRNHYVLFSINGFSEELIALARSRRDLALLQ